jgi:hypothetical protein
MIRPISLFGSTFRTSLDVRVESVVRSKADIGVTFGCWRHEVAPRLAHTGTGIRTLMPRGSY